MATPRKKPASKKPVRKKQSRRPLRMPPSANTGNEPIPPGATVKAADRPLHRGGGAPGSGGGPRHASGDPGSANESLGREEAEFAEEQAMLDEPFDHPAYGGPHGGAVGGTPAQKRVTGGRIGRGLDPGGSHRGDSTIGARPDEPSD